LRYKKKIKEKKCSQTSQTRKKATQNPPKQNQISKTQTVRYKKTIKKLLTSGGGGGAYVFGKVRIFKDGSPGKDRD
jgi:hypothetical protein